jgi:hypothetical protein
MYLMDKRNCPDCDRPLTRQEQKSGATQWICRKGKHRSGCGWNMTEGGRLPGGKVKGDRPMTGAERIKNFREKEKAMSEVTEVIDTRHEGQVVWVNNGRLGRNDWSQLTITKVLKLFVRCSDGKEYKLLPGEIRGAERGRKHSKWASKAWITTEDKSADLAAKRQEDRRKEMAVAVQSVVPKLDIDKLDRILTIINEGKEENGD